MTLHRAWLTIPVLAAAVCLHAQKTQLTATAQRVRLQPRLAPGDVLRYQIHFQTTDDTRRSGAVEDPQGPTRTSVTWNAILRFEVLPVSDQPGSSPTTAGAMRLRMTYEKSAATLTSDTPNPNRDSIEQQYARMQDHSFEITMTAAGRISSTRGLEDVVSDQDAMKVAQQWLNQFSSGAAGPAGEVAPGDQWNSVEPAASLPLGGHVWQSDAVYVANQSCPAPPGAPSTAVAESCAVISTRTVLVPPRSKQSITPPEYSRNGLQTSGTWNGSGESRSYISLKTGRIVNVTQNMSEQMNVTIANGRLIAERYAGTVTSSSVMSLLPSSSPAQP